MTGYSANTATGRVVPGVVDTILVPRTPRAGRYGVILCHPAAHPNAFMDPGLTPAATTLAANIAMRGIPCIAGDFGGDLFGNDTQLGYMDTARTVLAAAVPSMAVDKVLLLGISQGGAMAVRYAIERPGQVAGIVAITPALDLKWLWENVPDLRAILGTAYGVTYPTPLPADGDTLAQAGTIAGVPQWVGYSTADVVTPPTNVTRFTDASGATAEVIDTTVGHGNGSVAKVSTATVLRFLLDNGG